MLGSPRAPGINMETPQWLRMTMTEYSHWVLSCQSFWCRSQNIAGIWRKPLYLQGVCAQFCYLLNPHSELQCSHLPSLNMGLILPLHSQAKCLLCCFATSQTHPSFLLIQVLPTQAMALSKIFISEVLLNFHIYFT